MEARLAVALMVADSEASLAGGEMAEALREVVRAVVEGVGCRGRSHPRKVRCVLMGSGHRRCMSLQK